MWPMCRSQHGPANFLRNLLPKTGGSPMNQRASADNTGSATDQTSPQDLSQAQRTFLTAGSAVGRLAPHLHFTSVAHPMFRSCAAGIGIDLEARLANAL